MLGLQQNCRQTMTLALRQGLKILQMSQLELAASIESEIEANPLLERKMSFRENTAAINKEYFLVSPGISLRQYLLLQAKESFPDTNDLKIAFSLIDQFDERGWLTGPLENQPFDKKIGAILSKLQSFDPPGVGARNLQEFLSLRLKLVANSTAELLVRDHFQDLLLGRLIAIQKKLSISGDQLQKALHELQRVSVQSNSCYSQGVSAELFLSTPDLIFKEIEDDWIVEVGGEELPKFSIRSDYIALYSTLKGGSEKDTMRQWITGARWLQRCLAKRQNVLCQIGELLRKTQRSFLSQTGDIIPIKLQELARVLNVHEATAWRAVSQKVIACPQGLIPLQLFFSLKSKRASTQAFLRRLVKQEDKDNPLTDQALSQQLEAKGICCARRTVSKYRRLLKIKAMSQRKALGS